MTTLLAGRDDLAAVVGAIPTEQEARADAFLEFASALVAAELGTVPEVVPDLARLVTVQVAARAFVARTDGVRDESAGPFRVAYQTSDLYLTKAERRLLAGISTLGVGIGSVRTPITAAMRSALNSIGRSLD